MTVFPSSDDFYKLRPKYTGVHQEPPVSDARVVTSGGLSIPVHSSVLASSSRVLEKLVYQPRKYQNSGKIIPILGVSNEAVIAFIRYIYCTKCNDEEMEKYGIHLLVLSHVYSVIPLKKICTKGIATRLTVDNVIDLLKLTRLCDAPDLYVKCMRFVSRQFKAVELTEGWSFLHDHDPWLELEILQYLDDLDLRNKRRRKNKKEQSLYSELSEAMDCLEHICTEGCTTVGPYDKEPTKNKKPCEKFSTCQGLQLLIHHFATCTKRVNGGCNRCKQMWQLLRLHSYICDRDSCRVPLCRYNHNSILCMCMFNVPQFENCDISKPSNISRLQTIKYMFSIHCLVVKSPYLTISRENSKISPLSSYCYKILPLASCRKFIKYMFSIHCLVVKSLYLAISRENSKTSPLSSYCYKILPLASCHKFIFFFNFARSCLFLSESSPMCFHLPFAF